MGTWSVSQGRFIDTPQEGATAAPTGNEAAAQSLLQMFLSNPTGKNASNLLSGYKELAPSESADEKKKKMSKAQVEAVLKQVEDSYFGGQKVLSYSYPGNKLSGVIETANAVLKGTNPELTAYLGLRDNLRPTLARAAGDVGNLSGPEQNRAVALIPTAVDTPEEAMKKLNQFRTKIGLPEKDYAKTISIDKLPLPEQQKYYSDKKIFGTTTTPPAAGFTTKYMGDTQPVEPTQDVSKGNLLQRIANTTEDKIPVNIPDLPYGAIGKTGGSLVPNPIGALTVGGLGSWLDQVKQNGIPLTRESESYKNYKKDAFKPAWEGLKTAGTSLLLHPIKTLSAVRNATAARKTGDLASIIKGGEQFAQTGARPEQVSMANKLLQQDVTKFGNGGKVPLIQLIEEATKRGQGAWSKAGDIKSTAAAGYNAATQKAITEAIKEASPTTGLLTNILGRLYKTKAGAKAVAKWLPWIGSSLYVGNQVRNIGQ